MADMTSTDVERDNAGRFVIGTKAGPGRPKGSRSKLGEAFIQDLHQCWEEHGVEALRRCATEEPAQFVRVVASLIPKDFNVNVGVVDPTTVAENFRAALALLGNEVPKMPASQPSLRRMKVLNP
jgi:hypothetical protein